MKLASLEQHLHLGDERDDPWLLYEQRMMEGWFVWKMVLYFDSQGCLSSTGFTNIFSSTSHRINVEAMCSMAWEHISSSPNKWIYHSCKVKGCKEGYVTIDGLEKVTRAICAAPRDKLKLPPGFPNIIQCCHNSPILGGKFAKASKFCSEHKDLEQSQATVTTVTVPPIAFSELTEQTTGKLPTTMMKSF